LYASIGEAENKAVRFQISKGVVSGFCHDVLLSVISYVERHLPQVSKGGLWQFRRHPLHHGGNVL
jgi:hypothetical protein